MWCLNNSSFLEVFKARLDSPLGKEGMSERNPCQRQGGWDWLRSKTPSNPKLSVLLWSSDHSYYTLHMKKQWDKTNELDNNVPANLETGYFTSMLSHKFLSPHAFSLQVNNKLHLPLIQFSFCKRNIVIFLYLYRVLCNQCSITGHFQILQLQWIIQAEMWWRLLHLKEFKCAPIFLCFPKDMFFLWYDHKTTDNTLRI